MALRPRTLFVAIASIGFTPTLAHAAKLVSVGVLDRDYLVVNVLDGEVAHEPEKVTRYTPELSTTAATLVTSWTVKSTADAGYAGVGRNPTAISRKKKMSGQSQGAWVSSDYSYEYTYQHSIYLKLPTSLQQGNAYTLEIAAATNLDQTSVPFTFDVYSNRSEAVHVNLVGYTPEAAHKSADLYHWMGDGGPRDYTSFVGNKVYVYDVASKQSTQVGTVALWKPSGTDVGGYNIFRSSVWTADLSTITTPGTYRLVVDGVGASQDFQVAPGIYAAPFRVAVRGYFYMRMGQNNDAKLTPAPRTPLYIPGTSPANTTVYLTTMNMWNAQYSTFAGGGDAWDAPDAWAAFRPAGNPTNPNATGGHADAADSDRHIGHVPNIYDMLLPYILTKGALADDNTGIAESGNGIPDILDEARYEVDYWLRLRDGTGYGSGVTNPNTNNELFQAGPCAMSAWANAANTAMLADAFRIAGNTTLSDQYKASAGEAWGVASTYADPMLDQTIAAAGRGRDLKMMAAAFLYNLTGDQKYEAVIQTESLCTTANSAILNGTTSQIWGTAAYLMTPQPVHFQTLWNNMKASVIAQAKAKEVDNIDKRPSRRATDETEMYFRTIQNVHHTLIAHAVTTDATEKALFHKALALEADWSLGRNPLNMIEMGTAYTGLAAKRSVNYMCTWGSADNLPGVAPGQTPYLNLDDWSTMVMSKPSALYAGSYPADFKNTWPIGEGYFDTPFVWAHSEFTPQQTMRGKMALYGYLYGINHGSGTGGGTGGASGN
ncbi:MAG TPA: glycoside hydrolase family 9 protein, partial [Polyangia bacterium]|nr:glycoside hydrolase family 9 protein [Polyangia bacterium]